MTVGDVVLRMEGLIFIEHFALSGDGLNEYINDSVKKLYD